MSNPFDLLGNDVEDATVVASPPKEIVKKTSSSKKADVPPPSADPTRARNNRPKPTGNEAAFKDKQAGRAQNKSKESPVNTKSGRDNRKSTDRHSRTGKTDSAKKIKQAWGDNDKELADEQAAEAVAAAELAADAAAAEDDQPARVSLEDYLTEQQSNEFNKVPAAKKVDNFDGADLLVKKQEVLVEATKIKAVKNKQQKTKQFLEFDGTEQIQSQKPRNNRDFNKKNNKGPIRNRKPQSESKQNVAQINKTEFPALV